MFRLMREYLHSYLHLNREGQSLPGSSAIKMQKLLNMVIVLSSRANVSNVSVQKKPVIYLYHLSEPEIVRTLLA